MKKYLYIAIAAATLASCSQDEVMEVAEKEAITFGNVFVGKSTRAAEDNTYGKKSLDAFKVYGTVAANGNTVNIFNGNDVTRPAGLATGTYDKTKAWTCTRTQYWIAGADYDFAAVAGAADGAVSPNANGMPNKITYAASSQSDLLYAENLTPTVGSLVEFTFDHLLAKAKFTLTNGTVHDTGDNATQYTYKVTELKITNSYKSATYDVATKKWDTTSATTEATDFGTISALVNGTPQECAEEKLLIPGLSKVTVSIKYEILINGKKMYETPDAITKTASIEGGILANHAYNFNLELKLNNEIEFTVTKAPTWVSPTHTVTVPEVQQ